MAVAEEHRAKIVVRKIDAAVRQLEGAIELWFSDADDICIHTLAAAALQIVEDLCRKKGLEGELLYDSDRIREEYRQEWRKTVRNPANFFKHSDKDDAADQIEFAPFANVMFLMVAIKGLGLLGQRGGTNTELFAWWLALHEPQFLNRDFAQKIREKSSPDAIEAAMRIPKSEFLRTVRGLLQQIRAGH